jgi:hypothetical protein
MTGEDESQESLVAAEDELENARMLVRVQEAKVSTMRSAGLNTKAAEDLLDAYIEGERLAEQRKARLLACGAAETKKRGRGTADNN